MPKIRLYRGLKTPDFRLFSAAEGARQRRIWKRLLEARAKGDFSHPASLDSELRWLEKSLRLGRQYFTDRKDIASAYAKTNRGNPRFAGGAGGRAAQAFRARVPELREQEEAARAGIRGERLRAGQACEGLASAIDASSLPEVAGHYRGGSAITPEKYIPSVGASPFSGLKGSACRVLISVRRLVLWASTTRPARPGNTW